MKNGDMEEIYREHFQTVYKYLFCLTKDPDLSEELTQETFSRALSSLGAFRGDAKISTWLCSIAKRVYYKELDKKKGLLKNLDPGDIRAGQDLEEEVFSNLGKLELYKALQRLPAPEREVLYLRLTGELKFSEIGEILGKSEIWARVTFYRGKKSVIQSIGEGKKDGT